MRAYARQAKNRELEVDGTEMGFRAERRLGELIQTQKETVGLAKPGPKIGSKTDPNYQPHLPMQALVKSYPAVLKKWQPFQKISLKECWEQADVQDFNTRKFDSICLCFQ